MSQLPDLTPCSCGHPANVHRHDSGGVCAIEGCTCPRFREATHQVWIMPTRGVAPGVWHKFGSPATLADCEWTVTIQKRIDAKPPVGVYGYQILPVGEKPKGESR